MLLTGLAWGISTGGSAGGVIRLSLLYVFVHFILSSVLIATAFYFFVGRLLGPGIAGLPGRRRQQGLFVAPEDREQLEFGYCFDVRSVQRPLVDRLELINVAGRNPSILSGLGATLRPPVHLRTLNI